MKILVTGAQGFIGSNFVQFLANEELDAQIYALARADAQFSFNNNICWINADLSEPGWTKKLPGEQIDVVLHLAQSRGYRNFPEQSDDIFSLNVASTYELAEWSLQQNIKHFIFASTGNVYGKHECPLEETYVCSPESMYGASKLAAEVLLKPFADYFGITVMRLFGIYGPEQKNSMLPNIIQRYVDSQPIQLASNIGVRFNPLFISDCNSIIHKFSKLEASGYNIINVGGPEVVDILRVINYLEEFGGKRAIVNVTDEKPVEMVPNINKLRNIIAHNEFVSFKDGFKKLFDSVITAQKKVI